MIGYQIVYRLIYHGYLSIVLKKMKTIKSNFISGNVHDHPCNKIVKQE